MKRSAKKRYEKRGIIGGRKVNLQPSSEKAEWKRGKGGNEKSM